MVRNSGVGQNCADDRPTYHIRAFDELLSPVLTGHNRERFLNPQKYGTST
jgi:hypothetical protein